MSMVFVNHLTKNYFQMHFPSMALVGAQILIDMQSHTIIRTSTERRKIVSDDFLRLNDNFIFCIYTANRRKGCVQITDQSDLYCSQDPMVLYIK